MPDIKIGDIVELHNGLSTFPGQAGLVLRNWGASSYTMAFNLMTGRTHLTYHGNVLRIVQTPVTERLQKLSGDNLDKLFDLLCLFKVI